MLTADQIASFEARAAAGEMPQHPGWEFNEYMGSLYLPLTAFIVTSSSETDGVELLEMHEIENRPPLGLFDSEVAAQLAAEALLMEATRPLCAEKLKAADWEADHQRRHLEALGLADEFPFDCDSIQHVGEALLAARERVKQLEATRERLEHELSWLTDVVRPDLTERIAALESSLARVTAALPKTKDGETALPDTRLWFNAAPPWKPADWCQSRGYVHGAECFRRHPETGLTPEEAEAQ